MVALCFFLTPIGRRKGDPPPPVDEHMTNVVTSCFQFAFNLGQVA